VLHKNQHSAAKYAHAALQPTTGYRQLPPASGRTPFTPFTPFPLFTRAASPPRARGQKAIIQNVPLFSSKALKVEELSRKVDSAACGRGLSSHGTRDNLEEDLSVESWKEEKGVPTDVHVRFQFHPVGQGLFYSAEVDRFHANQVDRFTFVYDCGTDSDQQYMKSALDAYTTDGKLDLLILSHFHNDHINGVHELLKKSGGVREVVLPYLHPAERLMAAAGYAVKNRLHTLPPDYIAFLTDPIAYLIDNSDDGRVERITFIAGGPPAEEDEWPEDSGGIAEGIKWYDGKPGKAGLPDLKTTRREACIRSHSAICRAPIWRFKFYCRPSRASAEDIQGRLRDHNIDPDDLASVLDGRLEDLKKTYYSLCGRSAGQNVTSLMCCHGPGVSIQFHPARATPFAIACRLLGCPCPCVVHSEVPQGLPDTHTPDLLAFDHMLTGDANVDITEYRNHFTRELKRVGLFCLPHHGSKQNWHYPFLDAHKNCLLWVCSAGLGNRYGHPHKSVVNDLLVHGKCACICHELQPVTIEAAGSVP
jgi:hypothetical protein